MIRDIGHLALQVEDVDAAVAVAVDVFGMAETERAEGTAYLTHRSAYPSLGSSCPHHVLELIPGHTLLLDHIGLVTSSDGEGEVVNRVLSAGGSLVSRASEPGIDELTRVAAPTGHVFELYSKMSDVERAYVPAGVPPSRLGHATLRTADPDGLVQFFVDAFGFQLSDRIVAPDGTALAFARCHFDHHTLAVFAGPGEGLHHLAFEVPSMVEIGALADCVARRGQSFAWGPVRHGAGDNMAVYLDGPGGVGVEVYAGMHRIVDENWEARTWTIDDPRGLNYWAPPAGFEEILRYHAPIAPAFAPA